MSSVYLMLLILCIIFIFIFMYIEPMLSKHKIKNDNEYGSARFTTKSEIKNNFKKESVSNIKETGFPVWYSKNLRYVWFDRDTPHYVYLGSTGSGKSVTAVIPTCSFIATAKKKRSVFITDPKGEIFHTTSKMFKDNGYNIITIDFRNPELSNKINILEPIIKEYEKYMEYEQKYIEVSKSGVKDDNVVLYNNKYLHHLAETNRLIASLSQMIIQDKIESKDPFWNNSARQLLEGLIGFYLEEYKLGNIKRSQITMTSIRKFQNSSMEKNNFKKFKEYVDTKEYGSKSKDSLTSILSTNENTLKSVTAVFGEKMALFDDVNVANVTSSSDFDFDILGKCPTAFYVIVPDEDKTYYTLVSIIVGLLYKELVKLANNNPSKRLTYELDWILDEFANCPPLIDIESIVSVARSRGMRFHFFIQSFSQLNNVYGKEVSQIILDNCGLVYLKTNTQDTAEEISKRLGKRTIETKSINQSVSLLNYNGNKSTSLIARDLLTPDEVKQLHYKTIIFPTIGYPILRDTVLYDKFSCYQKGEVKRNTNNLRKLDDTYFTVEDIKYEIRQVQYRQLSKEQEAFFEEQENFDKSELKEAVDIVSGVLNNEIDTVFYKKANNRFFASISLKVDLDNKILLNLKSKINNKKYHICLENNKNILEIHLKNLF